MDIVTFQLDKTGVNQYPSGVYEVTISVVSQPNTPSANYVMYKHTCTIKKSLKPTEFRIKYRDDIKISVDSSVFLDETDVYIELIVYYRTDSYGVGPIYVGFLKSKFRDSVCDEQVKKYYKFRQLVSTARDGTIKQAKLSSIENNKINQNMLDEEYKQLLTKVQIKLHEKLAIYKGGSTLDGDDSSRCFFVSVVGPERVNGFKEFSKYTHYPILNFFSELELTCIYSCCNLIGFKSFDYNAANTQKISVFFCHDDSNNSVPLLIGIFNKSGNAVSYFRLTNIYEDKSNPWETKWIKNYTKIPETVQDIEQWLRDIHGNNKIKIDKILKRIDPYKKTMDGLMVGFGLCTILLALVSSGIWIYLNLERARNAFNNVYRRL